MNTIEELESRGMVCMQANHENALTSLCISLNEWYSESHMAIASVRLGELLTPQGRADLPAPIASFPFDAIVCDLSSSLRIVSLYYNSDFPGAVSTELLSKFCDDHGICLLPIRSRYEYSVTYSALNFFEQYRFSPALVAGNLSCPICDSPFLLEESDADIELSRLPSLVCSGTRRTGRSIEVYCKRAIVGLDVIHDIFDELVSYISNVREDVICESLEQATKEPLYIDGRAMIDYLSARVGISVEDLDALDEL